jgi:RNA polymerase sigma-70 factor (ECF subfamily)
MPEDSHSTSGSEQARQQAQLEQLLGLAVAGDEQARNQLLVALLPRLRDQVKWSLGALYRDAQSDVLDSAIGRILDQTTLPATLTQFRAWVWVIIRNRSKDEWRRRIKGPRQLDGEVPDQNDDRNGDLLGLVWPALQLLPDRDRQVLEQTFYEDKSSKEIGVTMDLSEGAVRVLRHRALKKLRELLENPNDHR